MVSSGQSNTKKENPCLHEICKEQRPYCLKIEKKKNSLKYNFMILTVWASFSLTVTCNVEEFVFSLE